MADNLRSEILSLKSSLFFTKIVETPKRMGKKDLFGYAKAELEMSAPLPMSQISFCCAKGDGFCVIFCLVYGMVGISYKIFCLYGHSWSFGF